MIRYLDRQEKPQTRELYEEAFPEDKGSEFLEYYYREKMRDNDVIVDTEDGNIICMAHINPYAVKICEEEYNIDYIVAVATKSAYRRQGHMHKLFEQMLLDMYDDQRPFTFLLPANAEYYRSLGFAYISDHISFTKEESWTREVIKPKDLLTLPDDKQKYLDEIRKCMNLWLSRFCDLFILRTEEYMERLCMELDSENGRFLFYRDEENCRIGLEVVRGEKNRESGEFIADPDRVQFKHTGKEYMMGRIVNLEEFIPFIHLREDSLRAGETFKLRITDDVIPDNEGTYLWHINRETSYLERLDHEDTVDVPEFTIGELASWLFGYTQSYKADFCPEIQTLKNIWITEEV